MRYLKTTFEIEVSPDDGLKSAVPTLSYADLVDLAKPINFSQKARVALSPKGIEAINKALCSDLLIHYDELGILSDMSSDDIDEYRNRNGDLKAMDELLDKAAVEIVQDKEKLFRDSIKDYLKVLEGKKKKCQNIWAMLVPILTALNEACTTANSRRNDAVIRLHKAVGTRLALLYINETSKSSYTDAQRQKIKKHLIDSTVSPDLEINSFNFPIIYAANIIDRTARLYKEQENRLTKMVGETATFDKASLRDQNNKCFQEVQELAQFTDAWSFFDEINNMLIDFSPDKENYFSGVITLRGEIRSTMTLYMNNLERFLPDGKLIFNISKDGELDFPYLKLGLSTALPPRYYEALRGFVLGRIRDYLNRTLNPPIKSENLPTTTLKEVEPITAEVREEIQETGQAITLSTDIIKSYHKLKGLSGSRVRAALETLLGQPLRIAGSHHIFRGKNGKTYPIALHGSQAVGVGMLRKCLKNWGIEPTVFVERVG